MVCTRALPGILLILSQTTGVPAHGAGLTGVREIVNTNNDPTIIVLQQNVSNEGADDNNDGDDVCPEGDENDDSDSVDTAPENLLLDANTVIVGGEQNGVTSDENETQGGNDQAVRSMINEEDLRRSTRQHRAPSSYIQSTQGNK